MSDRRVKPRAKPRAKPRGRPPLDLEISQRERGKKLAEAHRQLARTNPSDRTTAGRRDLTMPGYEFVGVPAFFIRRKIRGN